MGSICMKTTSFRSFISCSLYSKAWGNRFLWQYSREDDEELQKTYNYVVDAGVNWFDTADSYGTGDLEGQAEKLLGSFETAYFQEKKSKRSKVFFATKLAPFPWRIGSKRMFNAGLDSVERLCRPIDIVQLHWPPYWILPQLNDLFELQYLDAFAQVPISSHVY